MPITLVYTTETPPDTYDAAIFLAGPSPRDDNVPSWRPEALRLLEERRISSLVVATSQSTATTSQLTEW